MKSYYIIIASPVEYEELTAIIVVNNVYIAQLQMEEGKDKIVIEFFEETAMQKIKLNDFLDAIAEAKELLLK
jgi:hypothetical protein